jgi:hypothetical protein
MSNPVIHVKSCHSCQIMSLMSNHVSHLLFGPFPGKHSVKSGGEGRGGEGGGVKKVFLSLRRQLRCLAEGKKIRLIKRRGLLAPPDVQQVTLSNILSLSLSLSLYYIVFKYHAIFSWFQVECFIDPTIYRFYILYILN